MSGQIAMLHGLGQTKTFYFDVLPVPSGPKRTKDGKFLFDFAKPGSIASIAGRIFGSGDPAVAALGLDQVPPDMIPQFYAEAAEAGEAKIAQTVAEYAKKKGITIPGVTDRLAGQGGQNMGGESLLSRYGMAIGILAVAAVGSVILMRRK